MDAETYTAWLREKLEAAFDFEDPAAFAFLPLALWAVYKQKDERFFFTRKVKLYTVETDAYVLVHHARQPLTAALLESYRDAVKQYLKRCFKTRRNHMSSVFTLVITAEGIPEDVRSAAEKLAYHKDFTFTLRGWADLALVVVDLASGEVCCNAMAKQNAAFYAWRG